MEASHDQGSRDQTRGEREQPFPWTLNPRQTLKPKSRDGPAALCGGQADIPREAKPPKCFRASRRSRYGFLVLFKRICGLWGPKEARKWNPGAAGKRRQTQASCMFKAAYWALLGVWGHVRCRSLRGEGSLLLHQRYP